MAEPKLGHAVYHMNVFRVLGDISHTLSKCILIWAIHSNKSAEGVSLLTQVLYTAVFVTRYLDLFTDKPSFSYWNFVLKNFYIWSSLYIIILMTRVYARTREKEKAFKLGGFSLGGSLIAAPLVALIFQKWLPRWHNHKIMVMFWVFSIILESVCVLPQLLLLRQTTVPTVIDSFYLVTLGAYRGLYILNWMVRGWGSEHYWDPVAMTFGVIQTALYLDFAWVYWSRQRVKLRHGGVVDSDDLRKGWFVNRIIGGRRRGSLDEEDIDSADDESPHEDGNSNRKAGTTRWGPRGISISADDTLPPPSKFQNSRRSGGRSGELQGILEDDDLSSEDEDLQRPRGGGVNGAVQGVGGEESSDWSESARQTR